jgi:general stress protein CsbA
VILLGYLPNMRYAHWMIAVETVSLVVGFVGFAFRKNQSSPTDSPRGAKGK